MSERPILFRGELVRAILDGRKTVTRRPVKFSRTGMKSTKFASTDFDVFRFDHEYERSTISETFPCRFGKPGDHLWVRHDWYENAKGTYNHQAFNPYTHEVIFKDRSVAKVTDVACVAWGPHNHKPSIHMPRWASRITLEITSVRVERIQDISWVDLENEGYEGVPNDLKKFTASWNATYPGSWDRNDWVWVIEFKRITQ